MSERGRRRAVLVILTGILILALPAPVGRREPSPEVSAIVALKMISSAQIAYAASCGNGGYAASFDTLDSRFLPSDVRMRFREESIGYAVTLSRGAGQPGPKDCQGRPTFSAYYAAAVPTTPVATGARSFAMNAGGEVWQARSATPPVEPFGLPATPMR